MTKPAHLLAPVLVFVLASGSAAMAQLPSTNRIKPPVANAPREAPRAPAPPALPGSRAEPTAVAPADRSAADLPPTEALFDAINRGDITTARDAISRGADLGGRNVLGLSPLELSVDLGRNDISFLLLSLRAQDGDSRRGPPPGSQGGNQAEAGPSGRQARAQAVAERRAQEREQRDQRRLANLQPANPNAGVQTPHLFARDGGAPIAEAGFLGFDPTR